MDRKAVGDALEFRLSPFIAGIPADPSATGCVKIIGELCSLMYEDLNIILYPDPRLKRGSNPIESIDPSLRVLVARMFELMGQAKGVGLAAPQVGQNVRLFVINPTGEPDDARVYINPEIHDIEGNEEAEEGCLSLPGINAKIVRGKTARITAQDIEGNRIEETQSGYVARIWQHELDHLNGVLLMDRMGPVAKMAARRTLKELEEKYKPDKSI